MASAGARAYNGGLEADSPQRGPGVEPLVRGSERLRPSEAERLLGFGHPMEATNLPYSLLYMLQTQETTVLL